MKFWITFGAGHRPYGQAYSTIEADTEAEAREAIYKAICGHWCTTYTSAEKAGIEEYALNYVAWEHIVENPPTSSYHVYTDQSCPKCGKTGDILREQVW